MGKMMAKFGTKEWAEVNKNILIGCPHLCKYCFSKYDAVKRFKRVKEEDWANCKLNEKAFNEKPKKIKGRIMFPTTHDLPFNYYTEIRDYLEKWLEVGNDILIVSKPSYKTILNLCLDLRDYKDQIVFRFTIGSTNNDTLRFWEPGAPLFAERLHALEHAYEAGFKTSVSCEPFLDDSICEMVDVLYPYITNSIWIGIMNFINQRVDTTSWTEGEMKFRKTLDEIYAQGFIDFLYTCFQDNPKVRWKDSIKKMLNLPEEEIG